MPPISAVASSVSESCVGKPERGRLPELRREQAAGDAGHERRERERPELVERDVHARGERGRLALADRRPGAARACSRRAAARAGTSARRRRRRSGSRRCRRPPSTGRRTGCEARRGRPRRAAGEAVAAVREVDRRQHDVDGAGRHQRDQGEVEAAKPQRRQPDQHADHAGDRAGREQQQRERQARRVREPRRRSRRRSRAARSGRARSSRRGRRGSRGRRRRPSRSRRS